MDGKYTGTRYVHSEAEIEARVWYEATKSKTYKQEEKNFTGNSEKRYFIKLNNFQINLYKSLPKFEKYDTINEDKKLKLFSDFYLPITLGISTYSELEEEKISLTKEEARGKLVEKLKTELLEEIGNKDRINDVKVNIIEEDEREVEIEVIYEVIENIGTEEKIIY